METRNFYGKKRVRVDEDSVLARLADWHARIKGRPVAAIGPETQDATLFVEDEVLIDGDDSRLAEELHARYGAVLVPEAPVPVRPAVLRGERQIEPDSTPRPVRLRFAAAALIDGAADLLEQAVVDGSSIGDRNVVVTSQLGASVAAIAVRHALEGRSIGLNLFGRTASMPLSEVQEGPVPGAGGNPFDWPAFSGRSRILDAWQLVDSIRRIRSDRFTTIGILDSGFWLDNRGVPMIAPGQTVSDLGAGFVQFNLQNEGQPAGARNPDGYPWHGTTVASAAAAVVNNAAGAAGSGGTVALPLFFQSDFSIDQILRCVRICTAWGIDVLNMSFTISHWWELFFPTSAWDKVFQFAFDQGVVMIASAGNRARDLPNDDEKRRPATRTPGVLTVGALDAGDNAAEFSNHGASVWLWAPGTAIPVAPDADNASGSLQSGTSYAAPIVAGVAAMMRFANSSMSAADIRRTLIDTGWNGSGWVTKGLDAFAAVFAAIRHTLPDTDEPNNTAAAARDLVATGPGGALAAGFGGYTSRSTGADADFWRFTVERFSTVIVTLDWYERLGTLFMTVEPEDPEARDAGDMRQAGSAQSGRMVLTGLLPPGAYRVQVRGSAVTAYRLLVTRRAARLPVDDFENNDSFAQAAHLLFEAAKWVPLALRTWGPGSHDATLHQERGISVVIGAPTPLFMNDDYFRFAVPESTILRRPTVAVYDADEPVDVTLYDASQTVLEQWSSVRRMTTHPPLNTTCYLKVSGTRPTRYRISTRIMADPRAIPGPFQEELELLPKWWGDPSPLRLRDLVTHFAAEVSNRHGDDEAIVFAQPADDVHLQLLDWSGDVLREAEALNGALFIDTRGIERGLYVMRASKRTSPLIELRTVPPLQ